jgi:hypothetical protein
MLFNTALADRNYPKSATVQNCFSVSKIATIYSPRFICGIVQSASKRSCTASKVAQRRTSNKRFKFVRCAHWDCVPQPLNLNVSQSYSARLFGFSGNLQYRSIACASNAVQHCGAWPVLSKIGNRSELVFDQWNRNNLLTAFRLRHRKISFKAELRSFKICAAQDV